MTAYKNRITGKICAAGILIICGLLLTSVDDCESMYLEETANSGQQQRIAQEQAERNARAERERAEQERRAAQSNSRNRPASGAQSGSQSAGSQAAASQGAGSQAAVSQGAGSQAAAASGGTGQPAASSGASYLGSISGKDWKLLEVRRSDKTVTLDRNKLTADGMGDLFTLKVDADRLSGKAAPNRYISTYQAGENNALTIAPSIATLMASIYDPERLREQEYFQYLGKVKSWKLNQGKLELYTTDASNKEAVLVYGN
ncbi:MAG: META domain-containing protein [Spirochaetaceae bacterium]|jgi:heat shock protein HslJ|nr:META domain-containing protein [Spirochaetaceae bacterium]